jgi:hypothetical protein
VFDRETDLWGAQPARPSAPSVLSCRSGSHRIRILSANSSIVPAQGADGAGMPVEAPS